jgi:hypothetical protein
MPLWRLRRDAKNLACLVVETSFGYALRFDFDGELVWWELQPTLEGLVASADRTESALVARGWQVIEE